MAQDKNVMLSISVEEYGKLLTIFHSMETYLEYDEEVSKGTSLEFYGRMLLLAKSRMQDSVKDYRRYTKEQDADTQQI
jgi:hypothetical protein|tara:strand:- start:201 stop:434 length:234 start_codon:yes stop_codon:yes gene_type:complete